MTSPELPDWSGGFAETLQWGTSVRLSRGGAVESRQCVRPHPVRTLQVGLFVDPAVDLDWQHPDNATRTVKFLPGAVRDFSVVSADTVNLGVRAEALGFDFREALILSTDGTEQVEVASPSGDLLIFDSAMTWSDGDVIYPLVDVAQLSTLAMTRFSGLAHGAQVELTQTSSARYFGDEFGSVPGYDVFRDVISPAVGVDQEVFVSRGASVSSSVGRRWEVADPGVGARDYYEVDDIARLRVDQSHLLATHAEILSMRRALYRRAGRLRPCFVGTGHTLDIVGVSDFAGVSIYRTEDIGWANAAVTDARRAVSVTDSAGAITHHFVELASTFSGTPAPDGESFIVAESDDFPADPVKVEWLFWARLDSDAHTIQHLSCGVATVELSWVALSFPESWA